MRLTFRDEIQIPYARQPANSKRQTKTTNQENECLLIDVKTLKKGVQLSQIYQANKRGREREGETEGECEWECERGSKIFPCVRPKLINDTFMGEITTQAN